MNLRNVCLLLPLLCLPILAEDFTVAPVPEPSSVVLLGTVVGGLVYFHRRSRKKK